MYYWLDLHTHLEWSIPINCILESAEKEKLINRLNSEIIWLYDFAQVFWMISRCIKSANEFAYYVEKFLINQFEWWAIYNEFRISPYNHVHIGWIDIDDIISNVIKWINSAYLKKWVIGKVIIEAARSYSYEHVEEVFSWTKKYYDWKYVVGFWIWWIEKNNDLWIYGKIFDNALDLWIPMTVHAWETWNIDNLKFCINQSWIKRIWHAVSYNQLNQIDKMTAKNKNKVIEVLISSNLALKHVTSIHKHHLLNMFNDWIKFTIWTDDSTLFKTSLKNELKQLSMILEIDEYEYIKLNTLNSIESAFCDTKTKNYLMKKLI